jgi:GNAT superfamily N-acetyltransferase
MIDTSPPSTSPRSPEAIRIRRLRGDEGALLRELRVRSLRDSPDAFGQTAEEAARQPGSDWTAAARAGATGDRRAWFVAERTAFPGAVAQPVGIVLGRRRPPSTVMVFSMWVDASVRRRGVGRRLIEAVETWSSAWAATHSVLWVFGTNEPALRFYDRIGYLVQTEGEDARIGARYGALAMVRAVRRPGGQG